MTEKQSLKAMLDRLKINYDEEAGTIKVRTYNNRQSKVDGDYGCSVEFEFEGEQLKHMGMWEYK